MSFNTHPALARALSARGYQEATPVQRAVLETEAAGRDMLVSAQTGSGKTVAFGMAIATRLLGSEERFAQAAEPLALVVTPTRELAMQVQRELVWLYAEAGARIATCVGGMDFRAEARQLEHGAHIVVGTPGRLRDHLERKRLNLGSLRSIVLDEADEMLDLGFREDLEFILEATPAERQTLLFSATIPPPIATLASRYQKDALRIETVRRDEQHADIDYRAVRVAPTDAEHAVVNLLRFHDAPVALVFCATREAVKRMHARLVERGFSTVALSGELSQSERTRALQAMRDGRARVLVATDVAARGLDLAELTLVIHADLPQNRETLLHRSGRTGRAGRKGLCVLVVPFNRRRKAEALIGAARLSVKWEPAPTADAIRQKDLERFLSDSIFTEPAQEEELALVQALQAARTPEQIALALARMQREKLPAPEDIASASEPASRPHMRSEDRGRPRRHQEGEGYRARPDHGSSEASGDRQRQPMVWFRLNIGRERNADPRWLLPLICRAGGVQKSEIGAIKISQRETRFQVTADAADQFALSVRTNKSKEGVITRETHEAAGDASPAPASAPPRATSDEGAPRKGPPKPFRKFQGKPGNGPRHFGKPREGKPDAGGSGDRRPVSKYAQKKKRHGERTGS
ncbi:MAG: DEAD/DEAH box helicase [Hyphomicrobiales bacterium]|nr:MAG: DEAD/DEAH box helicase [Hyphomicrobiales bacterium]